MDDTSISDEVLLKAQQDINELLKSKKLPASEKVQLEIQSYFLMFLVSDHKKLSKMYPWFEDQKLKQERWDRWWDRLQWVVIPLVVGSLFAFVSQALYFWFEVVPKLH